MKNKIFKFCLFAALAVISILGLQSFGPTSNTKSFESVDGSIDLNAVEAANVGFISDMNLGPNAFTPYKYTLIAATADTTNNYYTEFPVLFMRTYCVGINGSRTNVSGTTNLKVWLEQSVNTGNPSTTTQTDWLAIDSASTTGATTWSINRQFASGTAYRLRVKGTGAQRNTYSFWAVFKPIVNF